MLGAREALCSPDAPLCPVCFSLGRSPPVLSTRGPSGSGGPRGRAGTCLGAARGRARFAQGGPDPLLSWSPSTQWPGLLPGSAGKQLSDWSSKCRLLWFGIWIMEVKSFCQSQETVGLRLTSYLWSDWLPISCSWPFIIASDVMVQQSWWAHKLLHSAFLPVITQTISTTICLLFQSWNWLWPWGGRFKQQYCISRSRASDRLPLLHCARNKRGGSGLLLVPLDLFCLLCFMQLEIDSVLSEQ